MPGNRRFRPSLRLGAAALAGIALTVSLGNWQTRRAEEKLALGRELDNAARHAVLVLPSRPVAEHDYEFRHVSARGEYAPKYTVLLDNKVLNGTAGYQVLTPLRIAGAPIARAP